MTYNKKQMQPLIEKFQINPETNKLFAKIIEMYDNQPNYQIWAVKGVFSKTFDFETLAKIHDWSIINQTMIKSLEKKNIVSYSTKAAITQLLHEMTALDNVAIIKDIISHFNTDQRKMLTEAILPRELNGLEAYQDNNVKTWGSIFAKFNRLPSSRKNNFYTKASGIRNTTELQGLIKDALEATYTWNKDDLLAYIENNTKDVEIVFNQGPYVIIRVPNFEMSKKLCGGGRTQWCLTMEKDHWNSYVGRSADRDQYFLFDFNRRETDPFAHIGFTIQKGYGIVEAQTGPWKWLIFQGHIPAIIAFFVFLIAGNAEANRGPFDMAEAESELTAGHHTEYSGMGFGFFYLAEFLNLFIIAGIAATVFLGGWAPVNIGIDAFDAVMNYIPGIVWFMGKTFFLVWILMWIKWTFPRLRIDQILKLEWKYLMPLALLNLVVMTVVVALGLYIK